MLKELIRKIHFYRKNLHVSRLCDTNPRCSRASCLCFYCCYVFTLHEYHVIILVVSLKGKTIKEHGNMLHLIFLSNLHQMGNFFVWSTHPELT